MLGKTLPRNRFLSPGHLSGIVRKNKKRRAPFGLAVLKFSNQTK